MLEYLNATGYRSCVYFADKLYPAQQQQNGDCPQMCEVGRTVGWFYTEEQLARSLDNNAQETIGHHISRYRSCLPRVLGLLSPASDLHPSGDFN